MQPNKYVVGLQKCSVMSAFAESGKSKSDTRIDVSNLWFIILFTIFVFTMYDAVRYGGFAAIAIRQAARTHRLTDKHYFTTFLPLMI